ncbi:unnamed protein product [Musa banksii]
MQPKQAAGANGRPWQGCRRWALALLQRLARTENTHCTGPGSKANTNPVTVVVLAQHRSTPAPHLSPLNPLRPPRSLVNPVPNGPLLSPVSRHPVPSSGHPFKPALNPDGASPDCISSSPPFQYCVIGDAPLHPDMPPVLTS